MDDMENGVAVLDVFEKTSEAAEEAGAGAKRRAKPKPPSLARREALAEAARAPARPAAEAGEAVKKIVLPRLQTERIMVRITGVSPLIMHKWSTKAVEMMLGKQMGKASSGKEHKDPQQDYMDSIYRDGDGKIVFPSLAFKSAAVTACTSLGKAITKVAARQAFHVMGEFVRIEGEPRMRQDMVRVGMGTADIRFRAEFPEWEAVLPIVFNTRVFSDEQLLNLFNIAGFAVGIGEWRPERDGQNGMFQVA